MNKEKLEAYATAAFMIIVAFVILVATYYNFLNHFYGVLLIEPY